MIWHTFSLNPRKFYEDMVAKLTNLSLIDGFPVVEIVCSPCMVSLRYPLTLL